jgi:hypothetical protein
MTMQTDMRQFLNAVPRLLAQAGLVLSTGLSGPGILKGSARAPEGQLPPALMSH